jgi:large subunit ribosomal protein L17
MVTLAKQGDLAATRRATSRLRITYNKLTPKEARAVKKGDLASYNRDRRVIQKLFGPLKEKFKERQGGYTRIIRMEKNRVGDNATMCYIEYL